MDSFHGIFTSAIYDLTLFDGKRCLEASRSISIHMKTLQTKLHASKKKPTTMMSEYLMDIRATMDTLLAAGSNIYDEKVIGYVVDES